MYNYWRPANQCHQIIHHRFTNGEDVFHAIASSVHDMHTPIMLSSSNWTAELVNKIWDERARCVFHVLVINSTGKTLVHEVLEVFNSFKVVPEFEYYFVVTTCYSCNNNNHTWLYSQLQLEKEKGLLTVSRGQTYRPFMVIMEYHNDTREIEQVHNFWLQCPLLYICVGTVNTTDNYLGRTREEAIRVLAYSFPQSQNPINYRGWPVFVGALLGYFLVMGDFNVTKTIEYRDFFANKGAGFALPLAKVALEIVTHLNATLQVYNDDIAVAYPITTMLMIRTASIDYLWRSVLMGTTDVNFLYCLNDTSSDTTHILLLFQPFDLWTWLCLVLAIICFSVVLKHMVGYFPYFNVLRSLLNPDVIPRGKTMLLLLLWITACTLLANLYTSYIQSLLVVPIKHNPLSSFQELAEVGYKIVYPELLARSIYLRGTNLNWYGLDESADLIAPYVDDPKFWTYFLRTDKRAFISSDAQIQFLTTSLDNLLSAQRCFAGRRHMVMAYSMWLNGPPNSVWVNTLLQRLDAAGILQLYFGAAARREIEYNTNEAMVAIRSAIASMENKTSQVHSEENSSDLFIKVENVKMILAYFGMGILISLCIFSGHKVWSFMKNVWTTRRQQRRRRPKIAW